MSSNGDSRKGICILSLDSGGPGTYSQLLILKEYMTRLATDLGVSDEELYPADYFDLIGGVGFGGLIAVFFGLLRMNITQAVDAVVAVASVVFPQGSQEAINQIENSENLKAVVEGMLRVGDIPLDAKMYEPTRPPSTCKVVLFAATSTDLNHVHLFRSYSHRGSRLNPTIIEAICATISIPSHFSSVNVGPRRTAQSFIGGPLGANNPTRELLKEACAAFGNDKRVAQITSIGCGVPPILSLEETRGEVGVGRLLKEMTVDCQMVAKDLSERLFSIEAYLRLNVENGIGGIEFDDWSVLGDLESHTRIYIENATVTSVINTSLQRLRNKIGVTTLARLNQSSPIKFPAKNVPPVSTHYVVRPKPFGIMVQHLLMLPHLGQRIFVITGMGGCGKTQMVSYFLQEHPTLYTRVVFVDASSSSSAEADFETWARALVGGHERDVWEDGFRILSGVPQDERWALILDNADDPTLKLVTFMPKNINLTIIITSRNRDLGNLSTTSHLELGEMEQDEALETLLHSARRQLPISAEEMESARTLMKELGYLALALAQAGTYCHRLSSQYHGVLQPYTFTQYFSLFCVHRATLMKKGQPFPLDSYERGVYTTLDLSYQALPQEARDFIHFISFFHYANIPLSALAMATRNGFADGESLLPRPDEHMRVLADLTGLLGSKGEWNEFQVLETITTLRSFSLISATPVGNSLFLQIHPLVQAWSRDMVSSTSHHYKAMAMKTLASCEENHAFLLYRHITPHILDILSQLEIRDIHVNDLVCIGEVLRDQGYYRKAIELIEAAVEKVVHCVGQITKETLLVTAMLATLYEKDGRWDKAEKLQTDVLEQRKELLGTEHPDTIMAAAYLAWTYSKQGRCGEAERLQVDVLEQQKKVLGMEHPDTITGAADLAWTYSMQGRWIEAEKLQVDILERRKKLLGTEHPDAITAAADLAETYLKQGRYGEAEKLQVDVLEQQKKVLGVEHPDTITGAAALAWTYLKQGHWGEAEKLQVDTLERRKKLLGTDHPDTIMAAADLAVTYRSQGRLSEATELLAPALKLSMKLLGQQHPDTQYYARELMETYEILGKQEEAEETKALLV